MNKELTSESYWSKYWKSKPKIDESTVGEDFLFHDVLEKYVPKKQDMSFLEVGGYPGMWAIYFAKFYSAKSSLLDRYADRNVIQALSKKNFVENIDVIEGDVFKLNPARKFDVVMSAGFIEHFSDVSGVVDKHIEYLKADGTLILTVPNFLGLNGLLQKMVDRETYETHFLETMYDNKLKKIVGDKNMEVIFISYYGKFCLWLEDINNKPRWLRRSIYLANVIGKFIARFESRLFSPYLVIVAKKK
jgi:SAM-dependent methyltransferase